MAALSTNEGAGNGGASGVEPPFEPDIPDHLAVDSDEYIYEYTHQLAEHEKRRAEMWKGRFNMLGAQGGKAIKEAQQEATAAQQKVADLEAQLAEMNVKDGEDDGRSSRRMPLSLAVEVAGMESTRRRRWPRPPRRTRRRPRWT